MFMVMFLTRARQRVIFTCIRYKQLRFCYNFFFCPSIYIYFYKAVNVRVNKDVVAVIAVVSSR